MIPLIRHELPTNTIHREDYHKILEELHPTFHKTLSQQNDFAF